jgi:hypothetical protein
MFEVQIQTGIGKVENRVTVPIRERNSRENLRLFSSPLVLILGRAHKYAPLYMYLPTTPPSYRSLG